jgi:hypothetical protein
MVLSDLIIIFGNPESAVANPRHRQAGQRR